MIDINATDFAETFDPSKATVGIIGQGFVGGAMKSYFERKIRVVAYDKYKPEFGTLDDVIKQAEVIFLCVPTPMRTTGECYTGIVEDCLQDIILTAEQVGRPLGSFVVVIKSTVPPGFTEKMWDRHPNLRTTFSPEFLTEKNAVKDMISANRVVVGGDLEDARVALRFFLAVDERRVDEGKCVLVQCHPTIAEMVKLFTNGILFTKILFANEIYAMCEKLGIPYDEVRMVSMLDSRIGSHINVPGPDSQLGAGGHCFPKDLSNLVFEASRLGVDQKIFTTVLERNNQIRVQKDWEEMKDRAVTEK